MCAKYLPQFRVCVVDLPPGGGAANTAGGSDRGGSSSAPTRGLTLKGEV